MLYESLVLVQWVDEYYKVCVKALIPHPCSYTLLLSILKLALFLCTGTRIASRQSSKESPSTHHHQPVRLLVMTSILNKGSLDAGSLDDLSPNTAHYTSQKHRFDSGAISKFYQMVRVTQWPCLYVCDLKRVAASCNLCVCSSQVVFTSLRHTGEMR